MRISDWSSDVCSSDLALLTRVFLELSTEHFLKTMKVPVPRKHERSGRSHWSDFGISIKEKIACALKVLDPEDNNRYLTQPRNGLSDKLALDRKSVGWGRSVSVRVYRAGRRIIKKKNKQIHY